MSKNNPKQLNQEQMDFIKSGYKYKDGLIYNKKKEEMVKGNSIKKGHIQIRFGRELLDRKLLYHNVV